MAEQDNDYSPARAATRAPIGRTIRLQFDDSMDIVEALCVNISIGGMFVAIQKARPKGSLVRFELVLDDQRSVRGLGEVVWMRPQGGGEREAGIGVKFRFLEQRERQLIFKLVSQHIKDRLSKKPAEPTAAGAPQPGAPQPAAPQKAAPQKATPRPATPRPATPRPAAAQPAEPQPGAPQPGAPQPGAPQPAETLADEPVQLPMFVDPPEPPRQAVPRQAVPQPLDEPDLEPAPAEVTARDERPPPELVADDRPSFDQLFSDFDATRLEPAPVSGAVSVGAPPAAGPSVAAPEEGTSWDGGSLWDEGLAPGEHAVPVRRNVPVRRRRAFPALAIGVLLAVLAALGFFLVRAGLFEPAEPLITTPPPPPAEPVPPPPEPAPLPAEPPPPSEPAPPPSEPPPSEPAPPPPAADASFSQLLDVTWASDPRGLKVVLTTDGEIAEGRFRHFRLDGDQPREVIRLLGVRERFARAEIAVGAPELSRIRIGFHREGGQNGLRVVLDLAGTGFGIVAIEPRGARLEVTLGKP